MLAKRQSELDDKEDTMRALQERNDEVATLKIELASQIEQNQELREKIDQENREKYEYASERSGSPPG